MVSLRQLQGPRHASTTWSTAHLKLQSLITSPFLGQDSWRQSPRFTLTFGMRWELGPAPSDNLAPAVDQVNDLTTLKLAAPGTPLWSTTFGNFAPRAGFAYELRIPTALRWCCVVA